MQELKNIFRFCTPDWLRQMYLGCSDIISEDNGHRFDPLGEEG